MGLIAACIIQFSILRFQPLPEIERSSPDISDKMCLVQILAIKQAAAIKARAGATVAANAMHSWMLALDDEYSWSRAYKVKQNRC